MPKSADSSACHCRRSPAGYDDQNTRVGMPADRVGDDPASLDRLAETLLRRRAGVASSPLRPPAPARVDNQEAARVRAPRAIGRLGFRPPARRDVGTIRVAGRRAGGRRHRWAEIGRTARAAPLCRLAGQMYLAAVVVCEAAVNAPMFAPRDHRRSRWQHLEAHTLLGVQISRSSSWNCRISGVDLRVGDYGASLMPLERR